MAYLVGRYTMQEQGQTRDPQFGQLTVAIAAYRGSGGAVSEQWLTRLLGSADLVASKGEKSVMCYFYRDEGGHPAAVILHLRGGSLAEVLFTTREQAERMYGRSSRDKDEMRNESPEH